MVRLGRRAALLVLVGAVLAIAVAWGIGFSMGVSHTDGSRDCSTCHRDGRVGWNASQAGQR